MQPISNRQFLQEMQSAWDNCPEIQGELSIEQNKILVRVILSDCTDVELIQFLFLNKICGRNEIHPLYRFTPEIDQAFTERKVILFNKAASLSAFHFGMSKYLNGNLYLRLRSYAYDFWGAYLQGQQRGAIRTLDNMIADEGIDDATIFCYLANAPASYLLGDVGLQARFLEYRGKDLLLSYHAHAESQPMPDLSSLTSALKAHDSQAISMAVNMLCRAKVPLKTMALCFLEQAPQFSLRDQIYLELDHEQLWQSGIYGSYFVDLIRLYQEDV